MIGLKIFFGFILIIFMFDRLDKLGKNEKISFEIIYVLEIVTIIVGVFGIINL